MPHARTPSTVSSARFIALSIIVIDVLFPSLVLLPTRLILLRLQKLCVELSVVPAERRNLVEKLIPFALEDGGCRVSNSKLLLEFLLELRQVRVRRAAHNNRC